MSTLSAQQGASIALAQREAAQKSAEQKSANSSISWNRTKPVQEAIKRVSQIEGVDCSFSPNDQGDRVYATLSAGNKNYAVIIDAHEGGYAIYKSEEYRSSNREDAKYEGGGKSLNAALGGIAMILGYHYPEQASAIDQAMQGQSLTNGIQPPAQG